MTMPSELIARLQMNAHIKSTFDAGAVGELLFNNLNMMFTMFVRDQSMPLDSVKSDIARQNRPVAAAIART